MSAKVQESLLLIDIQNDFCHPKGSLFISDAPKNVHNLIEFMEAKFNDFEHIFLSLDMHWSYDIAHPLFWQSAGGQPVAPFTQITPAALALGIRPSKKEDYARAMEYLEQLAELEVSHTIWPEHCLLGSWGAQLDEQLSIQLRAYSRQKRTAPKAIIKGLNPYTEHFSALSAVIADPLDQSTQFNQQLAAQLISCERLYIAGQALSHCVGHTLMDLHRHLGDEVNWSNLTLLTDCTSAVVGFEREAQALLGLFAQWGVQLKSSKEVIWR